MCKANLVFGGAKGVVSEVCPCLGMLKINPGLKQGRLPAGGFIRIRLVVLLACENTDYVPVFGSPQFFILGWHRPVSERESVNCAPVDVWCHRTKGAAGL